MSTALGRGVFQATLDAQGELVEGLTIALSQPPRSTARWRMVVRARLDEGEFTVGAFTTCPPVSGSLASRIVAIASCPGCREWTVLVTPAPRVDGLVAVPDESAIVLAGGASVPALPVGVQRTAERPKYYAGTSGVVQLLPGEELVGWSAWALGAGATVTFAGVPTGQVITVPTGGTVQGGDAGLIEGPATITFTATDSYLVEVAQSA